MDTTDAYHTYLIMTRGNNIKVYIDGELKIEGVFGGGPTSNRIICGDTSRYAASESSWDYVRYSTVPIEGISEMIDDFFDDESIDNKGIVKSLQSYLENVQKLLEKGKYKTAKNQLYAFIYYIKAQSNMHISVEAANCLINSAQALIETL